MDIEVIPAVLLSICGGALTALLIWGAIFIFEKALHARMRRKEQREMKRHLQGWVGRQS